jgi:hypothetical protein
VLVVLLLGLVGALLLLHAVELSALALLFSLLAPHHAVEPQITSAAVGHPAGPAEAAIRHVGL